MWRAYFDKLQVILERRLHEADVASTGPLARDLYSLSHYPILVGIVFFAVALEEAFLHPVDPPTTFTRWMLAVSIALYFLSQTAAMHRAYGQVMYERIADVVAADPSVTNALGIPVASIAECVGAQDWVVSQLK